MLNCVEGNSGPHWGPSTCYATVTLPVCPQPKIYTFVDDELVGRHQSFMVALHVAQHTSILLLLL